MRAETSAPIHEIIATRRSPRSLVEGSKLPQEDLLAILEAARWAPSAFNGQPWRFFVGQNGDPIFVKIFSALAPNNQSWAKNASALILATGKNTKSDGAPYSDYQFDLGLAVGQLVFETHHRGFVAHQMAGFDKDRVRTELEFATDLLPVVVIAIGKQDEPSKLEGVLLEREIAPRSRMPLDEIVLKGLPA